MSKAVAWAVFALGVAHILFGIVRFKAPLFDAVMAGFSGQFASPEIRRTAFWFILMGPMLMLAGHLALHAVAVGDLKVLKLIGSYMLVVAAVGVVAFPVSPLWAPLVLAPLLIAAGYGWLK
jgi:hypothetical protein